ncbi:hypothetical protein RvY_12287 [Ramazzottius varieornatus]|uniref:Uncharacterized protein n=1 Tax=Ramazzottius varieornatus TaxID=947166 RepID=A0A1D1VSQ9_RAMVA|nr:hypothetical protein RvY_12287 [Ramazzottius varieornatus]
MSQYQAEWAVGSNSWVIAADLHHAPAVVTEWVRARQPSTDPPIVMKQNYSFLESDDSEIEDGNGSDDSGESDEEMDDQ